MSRFWRRPATIGTALAAALALVSVVVVGTAAPSTALSSSTALSAAVPLEAAPADLVVDYAPEARPGLDPGVTSSVQRMEAALANEALAAPAARLGTASALAAGISVSYSTTYPSPPEVQKVVEGAISLWTDALDTNAAPIQVEVLWYPFGNTSILGSAGFTTSYRGGALRSDRFVPAPLANVLTGSDLNGPGSAEIQVVLNSSVGAGWFVATSGQPATSQIDLYSVVLHELGHGFGFVGSPSAATGAAPAFPAVLFAYDDFVLYGTQHLQAVANPASLLGSDNLFFDTGAPGPFKLYAPPVWQQGSSYSHFDEATYAGSSAGALMTPSLRRAETQHTIDAAVAGVLHQIGWPLRTAGPVLATIGGLVADQNGQGVNGVDVDQFAAAPDGSRASWLGDATTGADGRYRFTAAPGCYVLTFIAPAGASFPGTGQWRNVPVCVTAGQASGANDVRLVVAALGARIQGTVTRTAGGSANGVAVDVFAANGDGSRAAWLDQQTTDGQGRYGFDLDPGCYVLVFIAPDNVVQWVGGNHYRQTGVCLATAATVATVDATLQ